jgi:ubiquinone/menaquinone biosynthesis C-methylase UbiE
MRTLISEVSEQYKTPANLDARIQLHERFGHEAQPWSHWILDQIDAPANAHVLEVGCGTGKLWQENYGRIPPGWKITLSDQSAGMLADARQRLGELRFAFEQFAIQSIPFPAATLDVVIANHMLYHVPDLPNGLGEIRRVLKPGGHLYAATNGQHHMRELNELISAIRPEALTWRQSMRFTLEDGAQWLAPHFAQVELRRFDSYLLVNESAPLVDYVVSMQELTPSEQSALAKHVEGERQARGGAIRIQRDTGLFCAIKAS